MTTAKTTAPPIPNGVAPPQQNAAPPEQQYPDWSFLPDPEPVEDAMQQLPTINRIVPMIEGHFSDRTDVLVAGEAYLCWDISNKNAKLSPDCIVAIGINPEDVEIKNGYLIWEIGKPPDVVIEVASEHTSRADMTSKRERYAALGIAEYWRLDPSGGDRYGEPLVGEYLVDGEYRRIEPRVDEDGIVWSRSEIMEINLRWDGRHFATQDPVTGYTMLGLIEANDTARQERAARQAAEAREARERNARLQERNARLQERDARLQEQAAHQAAEARATQERDARLQEQAARQAAEAEVRALRAQLDQRLNQ